MSKPLTTSDHSDHYNSNQGDQQWILLVMKTAQCCDDSVFIAHDSTDVGHSEGILQ